MKLEEVKESDSTKLAAIFNHYATNTLATFHSSELSIEAFQEQIFYPEESKYRSYSIYLQQSETENIAVGYITLCQLQKRSEYDNNADITLFIEKEYVHRRIGRIVLPRIETIAKEKGFDSLLATIISENQAAISFFESMGYEQVAKIRKVGKKFDKILDQVALQKLLE